jgi:hypothetical protein
LAWLILNWCFRNRKCFTCQFRYRYRRTRREVFAVLSRIQNIGYEMGEKEPNPAVVSGESSDAVGGDANEYAMPLEVDLISRNRRHLQDAADTATARTVASIEAFATQSRLGRNLNCDN